MLPQGVLAKSIQRKKRNVPRYDLARFGGSYQPAVDTSILQLVASFKIVIRGFGFAGEIWFCAVFVQGGRVSFTFWLAAVGEFVDVADLAAEGAGDGWASFLAAYCVELILGFFASCAAAIGDCFILLLVLEFFAFVGELPSAAHFFDELLGVQAVGDAIDLAFVWFAVGEGPVAGACEVGD